MKKNIILGTLAAIGIVGVVKFLSTTSLYFTDAEAISYINYLREKNNLIGVSNFSILFFIAAAVIVTYLKKTKWSK